MKTIMHSYTFRAYPLEEAFRNAARFGWEGIELQPCHFDRQDVVNELPRCVAVGQEYGVPIECLDFGGDFINDDPAVREAAVAQVGAAIDAAADNRVLLMNGSAGSLRVDDEDYAKNGSALATDVHYDRAADAFRHLGAKAAERGVTICFEIHMNTIHDTIAATAHLLDKIGCDNVMANPDPANMFSNSRGERDPEALDALVGRIGYFHFKNCVEFAGKYNYSVRLTDGHIDFSKYIEKLFALGFDGPVCVEYCGAGDPHVAAEEDLRYLRQTIEWITARR